jgi:uncharacterized protein (DUF362 family)
VKKTNEPAAFHWTRRQFILRGAKTGLAAAVAGFLAYRFHDIIGPAGSLESPAGVRLADFSIADASPRMSIVKGSDRTATLRRALQAVGGMERYVKKGDRVVVKVNAAFATPPTLSATTHPDLVAEVVRQCLQVGAAGVIVTDNPINDPASCFTLSGIMAAARTSGAAVVLPQAHLFRPTTVSGGRLIRDWPILFDPFKTADKLIGIAPVKDHHRSGASMIMKNWYGLLGGRRNIFHQDIHTIIKELALLVKPTLVILDGTTPMITNGPTGGSLSDLKQGDTMIVGTDQVAADACGAALLGKTLDELPHIAQAAEAGIGTDDYHSLNPVTISI